MTLWLVRAGRNGEWEALAQEHGAVLVAWPQLSDLARYATKEALREAIREAMPTFDNARLSNYAAQLWALARVMKPDDLVAMPLKAQGTMLIGEVSGPYAWRSDIEADSKHSRPVRWLRDFPRTAFDSAIRDSFGSALTVSQVRATDAEARVRAMLGGPAVPAARAAPPPEEAVGVEARDLPRQASDAIAQYINGRFRGHRMAELVEAVLKAQGYVTYRSPEGKDGGLDVLAGSGPLGFDAPRIAVQVKSGEGTVGLPLLNELRGAMMAFKADRSLMVAWGGFTKDAIRHAREHFFDMRLWTADDLIAALQANYDALPDAVRAEVPMKRLWVLATQDDVDLD